MGVPYRAAMTSFPAVSATVVLVSPTLPEVLPTAAWPALRAAETVYASADLPEATRAALDAKAAQFVAEPMLGDPNFDRTVILMVEHNPEGALGLVLNRPTDLGVGEALPEWRHLVTDPAVLRAALDQAARMIEAADNCR